MSDAVKNYQTISAQKKLQRESKIPREWLLPKSYHKARNFMDIPLTCGVLNDMECDITSNFDATALLQKLKDGAWSAEQVTGAFCKRAAIAHQLVRMTCYNLSVTLSNLLTVVLDKLLNGDLLRQSNPTSP